MKNMLLSLSRTLCHCCEMCECVVLMDGWRVGMKITGHSNSNGAVSVCVCALCCRLSFFFLFFEWLSPIETNTHTQESFCIHSINQPITPSPPRHTFKVMGSCMGAEQSFLTPQYFEKASSEDTMSYNKAHMCDSMTSRTDSDFRLGKEAFYGQYPTCFAWKECRMDRRSNCSCDESSGAWLPLSFVSTAQVQISTVSNQAF